MFVPDYTTLHSLADFLTSTKVDYCLKQYIPAMSCECVNVLGDEALYCIMRPLKLNDFRSDVYVSRAHRIEPSSEQVDLAVAAAMGGDSELRRRRHYRRQT